MFWVRKREGWTLEDAGLWVLAWPQCGPATHAFYQEVLARGHL